jgi:hypothetical protein
VTDPSINNNGQRVIASALASSTQTPLTDVVVAISDNGGVNWSNAHLANAGVGLGVDSPAIASHRASPYGTYLAWTVNYLGTAGFIRKINYDLGFGFHGGSPSNIPQGAAPGMKHVRLDVGKVTQCNGQSDEAVFVAWAQAGDRCLGDGTQELQQNSWWMHVYDTVTGNWVSGGPWMIENDPVWAQCVGSPLSTGGSNETYGSNISHPMIAVDPMSSSFSIAHTESTLFGSQTHVVSGHFACSGGVLQPVFNGGGPGYPNPPCYNPTTGCPPNPDGTPGPNGVCGTHACYVVNDQWGSQVAFVNNGGTPETVVTWYDTRGDQYNNNQAAVWAMYSTNYGASWSNPFQVSTATWDETLSWWWDYQALAPSTTNFLAAWGGDAHLGSGLDGIWSAIIQ